MRDTEMLPYATGSACRYVLPGKPSRKRVLVIDDDIDLVNLIRAVLSRGGFEVFEAYDGPEGLGRFEAAHPALVILDVNLPRLDGWTVLERIRRSSDIPVIMLTVMEAWESDDRWQTLRAAAYITKPFLPQQLLGCVLELMND